MNRRFIQRKDGGRGLMRMERCVREEKNSLAFYFANFKENLIRGVAAAELKKQKAQELKKN